MKKHFITYGDGIFTQQSKRIKKEASNSGLFDTSYSYSREDTGPLYLKHKKFIDEHPTGSGYWIWKPWIILQTLLKINEGEIVVYADAGCCFVNQGTHKESREKSFHDLIDILRNADRPFMAFSPHTKENFTKNDYDQSDMQKKPVLKQFDLLENENFKNYCALEAGLIFIKKTPFTVAVMYYWMNLMTMDDYALIREWEHHSGNIVPEQALLNIVFFQFDLIKVKGAHLYGATPIFAGRYTDAGQKKGYHQPIM